MTQKRRQNWQTNSHMPHGADNTGWGIRWLILIEYKDCRIIRLLSGTGKDERLVRIQCAEIQKYHIKKENMTAWLRFCRTVQKAKLAQAGMKS